MRLVFSICLLGVIIFSSCTYHNEEELYPPEPCDTLNVSYSQTIAPIFMNKCNACHNSISQLGGVVTENYEGIKKVIDDGRFERAVNHREGITPMPKGSPKLSDCRLAKIRIWLEDGAPNN